MIFTEKFLFSKNIYLNKTIFLNQKENRQIVIGFLKIFIRISLKILLLNFKGVIKIIMLFSNSFMAEN